MNNDINLDYNGEPLDESKLKENFNTLKKSFPEIYFNYGCDHCTKEVRDKREGYCKDCMIWQESPSLENSLQKCRDFGVFALNDKNLGTFYFRQLTDELDITNLIYGEDYLTEVPVYLMNDRDFDVYKNYQKFKLIDKEIVDILPTIILRKIWFLSNQIIFTPKESINKQMIPNSMWELVKHYNLWRKVPDIITTHAIHGEKYVGKNIYIKLELIK